MIWHIGIATRVKKNCYLKYVNLLSTRQLLNSMPSFSYFKHSVLPGLFALRVLVVLWVFIFAPTTRACAQTGGNQGLEMNKLTSLRDDFVRRIEAMGYHISLR